MIFHKSIFILLSVVVALVGGVVEKGTGFDFPTKNPKLGKLSSLGLRKKGPIKVYAVGMYEDAFKHKGFMLKMAMGVSAQKMTNALVDAVKPRLKNDSSALEKFSDLMLKGLPDGCSKNMCLLFGTSGGKLSLFVNEKLVGSVSSKALTKAFADIYCDNNAVCKLVPI
uniref:Chalcone isomerase domain-containing protein n=1 Tax=Aureoumbra lagunensis TaxID=44058 RepID=A0A7S3K7G9_9STRA|mmetsp:Transcript_19849/g.24579  ORF Transcript_19849/g.24579 Transcript_19849/m.24579 type:complete len:168 (+) Transcript_19849:116-619(+)